MFTQSVHPFHEIVYPGFAPIDPMRCGDNPNVDRSAPPPAKKAMKKKGAKKAGKKR